MSTTEATIIEIIAATCRIDPARIQPEATLKDLGVPSLDAAQVLFEIEDRFDVDIPERAAHYATGTVRQIVQGVEQLLAAKSPVT